jgi:putative heme iron utilization protein
MMEPSWAERARTVLDAGGPCALATLDSDFRPVVTVETFIGDGAGCPVVVLSRLAAPTLRAWQDPRASVAVGHRLLLQGDLKVVPGIQQREIQARFEQLGAPSARFLESLDFAWFRLVPLRVRWVDARGQDRWLRPEDVAAARPDPLAPDAERLVDEISRSLGDDLVLVAHTVGGHWTARSVAVTGIDRYGLDVVLTESAGTRPARIPFPEPLDSRRHVHVALAAMAAAARSRGGV